VHLNRRCAETAGELVERLDRPPQLLRRGAERQPHVALERAVNAERRPRGDQDSLPGRDGGEAGGDRRRQADPVRFPDLSLSIVKLLGRGEYALDPAGPGAPAHFGLAVQDYTHSTAPNRRYPDVITQRLVKAALARQRVPYSETDIDALAQHCTKKEDDANKVERQVRKSAAALLLESRIGERFDAIVTGASAKGTWARALSLPVDGRIVRGFAGLDVGERVEVRLVGTDVERGFIDFEKA